MIAASPDLQGEKRRELEIEFSDMVSDLFSHVCLESPVTTLDTEA